MIKLLVCAFCAISLFAQGVDVSTAERFQKLSTGFELVVNKAMYHYISTQAARGWIEEAINRKNPYALSGAVELFFDDREKALFFIDRVKNTRPEFARALLLGLQNGVILEKDEDVARTSRLFMTADELSQAVTIFVNDPILKFINKFALKGSNGLARRIDGLNKQRTKIAVALVKKKGDRAKNAKRFADTQNEICVWLDTAPEYAKILRFLVRANTNLAAQKALDRLERVVNLKTIPKDQLEVYERVVGRKAAQTLFFLI